MAIYTPLDLQDELAKEIERLLSENRYKAPGGEMAKMRVFTQNIPINETDDEEDPIPYVIVRLSGGDDNGAKDSFNTVEVVLIVGIFDDSLDEQGYRDIMGVMNKIYHRFHKDPRLSESAVYAGAFKWMLQEDSYYPYSFGACNMNFYIPAIRREDPYA